jgi:bifunctional NMN adenylyltransferase/nudix hydrolase
MIERKNSPGIGTYAFPGGFVNEWERLDNAAVRELFEETGLAFSPKAIDAGHVSLFTSKVFDDPNRCTRGRVITNAYLWKVNGSTLPKVKAGDDAAGYKWFDLVGMMNESFDRSLIFSDHYDIMYNLYNRFQQALM